MEIKDDQLIINTAPVDAVGGAKPEPEERPAVRQMLNDAHVGLSRDHGLAGATGGGTGMTMNSSINAHTTVGEFLKNANPCGGCIHFDREMWIKTLAKWKSSTDPFDKHELNQARSLMMSPATIKKIQDEGGDIDAPLKELGVCTAISRALLDLGYSAARATTIVSPLATCPQTLPGGERLSRPLYKARKDAVMTAVRDDILFKAAGKKP